MLTWLEISKSALIWNLKQFKKIVGSGVKIMAVVKSNAYGHGIIECAKIFEKAGADYLGVINLDEALLLRKYDVKKPILILSYWDLCDFQGQIKAIRDNIEFSVYTERQLMVLANISKKIGKKAKIHLKIDTGTSRIGILPKNALNFAIKCLKSPQIELKGVFTHFAKSEAKNQVFTNNQAEKLLKIKNQLLQLQNLPQNILFHAGCTASTINNKKTFFNMVRIGIGLYGLWPSKETEKNAKKQDINLKPALTWKTKIIQVKELTAKSFIGYDCTYQCRVKTKIAVLPIGYWDGYDRGLSNIGEVIIYNQRAPILGRICMNLMMVDITKIKNAKVGDEAILLGNKISIEKLVNKIGTINYEIITRINSQLPRIYK